MTNTKRPRPVETRRIETRGRPAIFDQHSARASGPTHEEAAAHLRASQRGTLAAGCLLTILSALLTCALLFINGSLVMAILVALGNAGPPLFRNPKLMQFALFSMPVLLVVLQWMMLDYVRSRVFQKRSAAACANNAAHEATERRAAASSVLR